MALRDAGAMLWKRTDLTPADVDVAELYDGFSFITLCWLEALGFCGKGEGGPFVEGGTRIARDGEIPAQHPRRPAVGRAPPRLRRSSTRRACSCGARRASARSSGPAAADPRWPSRPPAAVRSAAASC